MASSPIPSTLVDGWKLSGSLRRWAQYRLSPTRWTATLGSNTVEQAHSPPLCSILKNFDSLGHGSLLTEAAAQVGKRGKVRKLSADVTRRKLTRDAITGFERTPTHSEPRRTTPTLRAWISR